MTRLARPRPGPRGEAIIALVDVVFFLLVFALLIGRMDATAPFEVDPPVAHSGADLPGGGVTISISAAADFALDGAGIEREQLLAALGTRISEDPALRIRVNADAGLALRHVLPLIDALRDLGAEDVVLVATPGE